MQPRCATRFESHTPKSPAMRKPISLIWNHRKMPEKTCENLAVLACDAKNRHVFWDRAMWDACDSDSRCGLACDASACDAKSLATWVEQCKPLRSGLLCCAFRDSPDFCRDFPMCPPSLRKQKAHEHKSFWPVTPPRGVGGSLPVRCPGVKDLCAIFGTQGT